MDYVGIGKRIRAQRYKLDLSQEELAEMAGISLVHMSHIEDDGLVTGDRLGSEVHVRDECADDQNKQYGHGNNYVSCFFGHIILSFHISEIAQRKRENSAAAEAPAMPTI